MTVIFEDPMPVILFGIIAEAVLGIALLRTGRGVLLWAMGGVLALLLVGVGLEWLVVTEREQVEATLEDVAAAVGANDQPGVLRHIDPSAIGTVKWVKWGFNRVDFTGASITMFEVENINHLTSPPTARVHVECTVYFEDRRGEYPYDTYPVDVTMELRRGSDRWLITGHEWHNDPPGR